MNCERIQELILTDYLDGVLKEDLKKQLEAHMVSCPHCLEFAKAAKKTAVQVFEHMPRPEVPEHVWSKIESSLSQDSEVEFPNKVSWLDRLQWVFTNPKPFVAFMAVFVLFISLGTVNQFKIQKPRSNEQAYEDLVSLINPVASASSADSDDFGTTVEQYFL